LFAPAAAAQCSTKSLAVIVTAEVLKAYQFRLGPVSGERGRAERVGRSNPRGGWERGRSARTRSLSSVACKLCRCRNAERGTSSPPSPGGPAARRDQRLPAADDEAALTDNDSCDEPDAKEEGLPRDERPLRVCRTVPFLFLSPAEPTSGSVISWPAQRPDSVPRKAVDGSLLIWDASALLVICRDPANAGMWLPRIEDTWSSLLDIESCVVRDLDCPRVVPNPTAFLGCTCMYLQQQPRCPCGESDPKPTGWHDNRGVPDGTHGPQEMLCKMLSGARRT
jgi:hypothetical protein